MRQFVYFIFGFLLFSCNGGEDESTADTDSSEIEFITTEEENFDEFTEDEITFDEFLDLIYPADRYEDKEYLIEVLPIEFESINTTEELFEFYTTRVEEGLNVLNDLISSYDGYPEEDWEEWTKVEEILPFYSVDRFCSECEFEAVVNALPFYEIAILTPDPKDEIYFEALSLINDGDEGYIYVDAGNNYYFQTMDCDFCTYNLLGDNRFYDALKLTNQCTDSLNVFNEELYELQDYTLNRMIAYCYQNSQKEAMSELEKIAMEIQMPERHMQKLYTAIDHVDGNEEVSYGGDCEFDF